MSTVDTTAAPSAASPRTGAGLRTELGRALALGRAETILLLRNPTALVNALLLPLLLVGFFALVGGGADSSGLLIGLVAGMGLLFIVYYTSVTAVVARREERTLKRLYTGQSRPATILIGMALPLFALLGLQVLLGAVAIGILVGLGSPGRWWLLLPAVVLGALAWWALALASTTFTRTVESAQITTLPLIMVALLLSGASLPLAVMPEAVQVLAQISPMYPVMDLAQLALGPATAMGEPVSGASLWRAVGVDVAVLVAWIGLSADVARRRFHWEPRR